MTVKPVRLMRWLCRLVTRPGGTVLDPFAGSGTTGIAAGLEGFEFVGIEREPQYAAIARARIAHWARYGDKGIGAHKANGKRQELAGAGQLAFWADG